MNLDRWEDRMEAEHPRAYAALMALVVLGMVVLVLGVLYLAPMGRPT